MFALMYTATDIWDDKFEQLKKCDLYKAGCTFTATSLGNKYKFYDSFVAD